MYSLGDGEDGLTAVNFFQKVLFFIKHFYFFMNILIIYTL